MIPGLGNQLGSVEMDNKALDKNRSDHLFHDQVTQRQKPVIIDGARRRRIALGSGTQVQDVNKLLKQFDNIKVMMKRVNKIAGKRGQQAALRSLSPF